MAWGHRCDLGCESWPDEPIYKKCPVCDEPTTRYSNLNPLPEDEAQNIKLRAEFDTYYERWCAQRSQSVDGPLEDPIPGALMPA